jgi:hypothetical protein
MQPEVTVVEEKSRRTPRRAGVPVWRERIDYLMDRPGCWVNATEMWGVTIPSKVRYALVNHHVSFDCRVKTHRVDNRIQSVWVMYDGSGAHRLSHFVGEEMAQR